MSDTLELPMPNETFDGKTVVASCWINDSYELGPNEDLSVAVVLLMADTPGSYYQVMELEAQEGDYWRVTQYRPHTNIVFAAEDYRENTGCV